MQQLICMTALASTVGVFGPGIALSDPGFWPEIGWSSLGLLSKVSMLALELLMQRKIKTLLMDVTNRGSSYKQLIAPDFEERKGRASNILFIAATRDGTDTVHTARRVVGTCDTNENRRKRKKLTRGHGPW